MRRKQIRNRNPDIGESSKVIAFGESNEGEEEPMIVKSCLIKNSTQVMMTNGQKKEVSEFDTAIFDVLAVR